MTWDSNNPDDTDWALYDDGLPYDDNARIWVKLSDGRKLEGESKFYKQRTDIIKHTLSN